MTFAARFVGLAGWRNFAALAALGALFTLGFAPYDCWPIGFVTVPLFFLNLNAAQTTRQSALRGFAFGYGHAIAGTYWIANSLLVDASKFGWLYPISVLGLSAVMALWFALFGVIYARAKTPHPLTNLIRFALVWTVIEYFRSIGMFGFPWNLVGSMALPIPAIAQLAALMGSYGLGLFLVLLFTLPALWLDKTTTSAQKRIAVIGAILALIAVTSYGITRMQPAETTQIRIRIAQGNIAQAMKWTQAGALDAEQTYSALTQQASTSGAIPPIVIWPETAVPIPLRDGVIWPQQIGTLLPKNGVLLTGVLRVENSGMLTLWNSLAAIRSTGEVAAIYSKHQLVPFGEFVPLRSVLPLDKITPGNIDFSRGAGVQVVAIPNVPTFLPLICYEVIFPWLAMAPDLPPSNSGMLAAPPKDWLRPKWLVNITNDGWYGDSKGPYQHLAAARLRAIEQGLPLARAANTGISAMIDPYGRILQSLPLGTRGIIDAALPAPLRLTPYARFGEWITLSLMVMLTLATWLWPRSSLSPALSDIHPSA